MAEGDREARVSADTDLLSVYASWSDELRSKYRRVSSLFKHRPSIGRSREIYLTEILNRCLPQPLSARHGAFYVPGSGASGEQDILIVNRNGYAPIEDVGDFGVFFLESVLACIEVKSRLTCQEMHAAVNALVQTKKFARCSTKVLLFAYEARTPAGELLNSIENSEDFIDYRPDLIVVLGRFVIAITEFKPRKPRPEFTLTAFKPKRPSFDLGLMELADTLFGLKGYTPFEGLKDEVRSHFEPIASRRFVCPVERPGKGLGTNR